MQTDIIIVGAGAAGLMAAYELSQAGKRVMILEARDRIGGRIYPLSAKEFGYDAEGGAEFTHGGVKVTKALIKQAGLTYEPMAEDGEFWSVWGGKFSKQGSDPTEESDFSVYHTELKQKLKELKKDLPIAVFLNENFADEKYSDLRNWISRMVQGFDAADPEQISSFSLRDEWLGRDEWEQGRVKEGYKALLDFLESECRNAGVQILLNNQVVSISLEEDLVKVSVGQKVYEANKAIVTVAIPVLKQIEFVPPILTKLAAAEAIGFGQVIKLLFRFQDTWWQHASGQDLSKMSFLFADQAVGAWWTQYPALRPVLTGWISGPRSLKFKDKSEAELLDLGLQSLANIFQIDQAELKKKVVASKAINWPADPLTLGAYSYSKVGSDKAYEELRQPVQDRLYFAGEAAYEEAETATVEGALASGQFTAQKILDSEN